MGDALEDWLAHGMHGLSTRTVQIAHNVLVRAIRQAERDNLVGRNAAALVDTPKGAQGWRPSKRSRVRSRAAGGVRVAGGAGRRGYQDASV